MAISTPPGAAKAPVIAQICTRAQFEAALERAARLLESEPAEGSGAQAELFALLAAIAAYAPAIPDEGPKAPLGELERAAGNLMAKAEAFSKAREARLRSERLTSFPQDGQGLGPTTGV